MFTKIGSWDVIEQLGSGGQGLVLKARKRQVDGSVLEAAIKIPAIDPSSVDARSRQMLTKSLVHEFEMLKLVSSPNVCRVVDSGFEMFGQGSKKTELPWLATELIRGDDLLTEVRDHGPLDRAEWVKLARDLCSGLTAIHSVGATHLDLKPQNIVRHARRAIIIDLGGASFVGRLDFGDAIGAYTKMFAAPEQLDEKVAAEDYEYPVDLYSLGAVLYFAATGEYLFDLRNRKSHEDEVKKRLEQMRSESFDEAALLPEQAEIIRSLVRFNPSDRAGLTYLAESLSDMTGDAAFVSDSNDGDSASKIVRVQQQPSPNTSGAKGSSQLVADADFPGWAATVFLMFLPPIIGPFIRYGGLRNHADSPSKRLQLRTLLLVGSWFTFGALSVWAFADRQSLTGKTSDKFLFWGSLANSAVLVGSLVLSLLADSAEWAVAIWGFSGPISLMLWFFVFSPLAAVLGVLPQALDDELVQESEDKS